MATTQATCPQGVASARVEQTSAQWKARYAARVGVEGTMRQATHVTGIRRARCPGLPKTQIEQRHLLHALRESGHFCNEHRTLRLPHRCARYPNRLPIPNRSRTSMSADGTGSAVSLHEYRHAA